MVARDFDPMAETNKNFYNLINNEDWEFDLDREFTIEDAETQEFTPPVMQYWIPSPIPGVFLRVDFTLEQDKSTNKEILDFLNNLKEFLNEEEEQW